MPKTIFEKMSTTARKDKHNKVHTAKGMRDRRMRLSAHTAIQFFDLQDRLGYDRPSKALDWLIIKAKNAIDKLNDQELPHWQQEDPNNYGYELIQPLDNNNPNFANTNKSFFPISDHSLSLPDLSNDDHHVIIPRESFEVRDLGLSLQSTNGNSNSTNVIGFQEMFPAGIGCWNNIGSGSNVYHNMVGFVMNSQEISQQAMFSQRAFLQSSQQPISYNSSSDIESHFEFGFGAAARICGEEGPEIQH